MSVYGALSLMPTYRTYDGQHLQGYSNRYHRPRPRRHYPPVPQPRYGGGFGDNPMQMMMMFLMLMLGLRRNNNPPVPPTEHPPVYNSNSDIDWLSLTEDHLGALGFETNSANSDMEYTEAEKVIGSGNYDDYETLYHVYDNNAATPDVFDFSTAENSKFMVFNDKGANTYDVSDGSKNHLVLENFGSDDKIIVDDKDSIEVTSATKTIFGWVINLLDLETMSYYTVVTHEPETIDGDEVTTEDRGVDFVLNRIIEE